jgi:uncharacterized protein with HEPN domain
MRPEKLYLMDIVEACKAIGIFCNNITFDEFCNDDMRQSAVLHKLIIIGEATAHLTDEFNHLHPATPWVDMIDFRNYAVHAYFSVKWEIIWHTAIEEVPPLCQQVEEILRNEIWD